LKILYVATNFTALSHTFITREIHALRKQGDTVALLSLRTPTTSAVTEPECDLSGCRHVYPTPALSLMGSALRVLATSPRRFGRAVRVAFASPEDPFKLKLKLLYQMLNACRFVPWLRREGIEHIHSHFAGPSTSYAMFLATLTGRPFTFTDHGAGVFHDRIGLTAKFRLAAGISAISEFNIGFYPQVAATVPPVQVVRCGLDLSRFTFRQREACGSPVQILAVSRIVPKKGFTYLLDGLALLDREGIPWRCRMVGEGPSVPELQSKAQALGLDARLEFTGARQQDEIREMMLAADMFVLPCVLAPDGDMDGIPVTLMEAMACGCPVVSTRISGVPELVIDGRSGLLLEPEDGEAVGRAMARLAREPDLAAALSRGGRARVEEEFDIRESARRLADFFRRIAAGDARSSGSTAGSA
jgi:glycosyltransferase involved in cell wall biosynthesis